MRFSLASVALFVALTVAAPDYIEDHPAIMAKRQGCDGGGGDGGSGYSGYSGYSGGGGGGSYGGYSGGYYKRDVGDASIASSLIKRVFALSTRQQGCNQGAMCTSDADCVSGLCRNPNPQCQVYDTCDPCAGS